MATCSRCGAASGEGARFCATCGAPLRAPPEREARKVVTILFCDLVESTKLAERFDPEALQRLLARYFVGARTIVERHGGTVEKFIGDAVCAVFGMPTVREDDALRAVRAAAELRDAVASLDEQVGSPGLAPRIGLNTGEVFAAGVDLSVAGDAVWTAKRLEEAAPRGGVLLGPMTWALVRGEADAERLPPVSLKGKSETIDAYLLRELRPGAPGPARRLDLPLVGRTRELDVLRAALAEAETGRKAELVMLLGDAGIGKTRLVRELAVGAAHVRLLTGRCLPYGEGITYWPLVEIVRAAAGLTGQEPAVEVRARLHELVADAPDADRIVVGVATAIGLGGETSAPEVFLAVRRLLECLAARQPLVVVVDDLQWAEAVFLDLLQYVFAEAKDVPLLLCCLARRELTELRSEWRSSATIVLETLPADEIRRLISNLLGDELGPAAAERVIATAGGNPLFVEELLRMLIDEEILVRGDRDGWRVARDPARLPLPASIAALLAARLERLPPEERLVLERAAVIGEAFTARALEALVDDGDRADLRRLLLELERKELIRSRPRRQAAEDEWRFGHILVRDAAYAGLPKLARARLHEAAARAISAAAGAIEFDEIGGYHLAQAADALADLDPLDERARALAAEAAGRLASGARQALARGDRYAAAALLERTVSLLPPDDPKRLGFLVDLGAALKLTGRLDGAERSVREAADRAEATGLTLVAQRASLELADLQWYTAPEHGTRELWEAARAAIPVFEREGAAAALVEAWWAIAEVHLFACEFGRMRAAVERGLEVASAATREERARMRSALGLAATLGPMPVREAIRTCAQQRDECEGHPIYIAALDLYEACLEALDGRFDEARTHAAASREPMEALGRRILLGTQCSYAGQIEMLAGDPAAAEPLLRDGLRTLREFGERGNAASVAADLARALHALGRDAEANATAVEACELGNRDDVELQVIARIARASAKARLGSVEEALATAHEAVDLAERTDALTMRGEALLTLARVLRAAGRDRDADEAARRALELFEAKENRVGAATAREFLAERELSVP
jgi:class 3 adenylate cyclase/tetratricopeptide (TPR) repeat protein